MTLHSIIFIILAVCGKINVFYAGCFLLPVASHQKCSGTMSPIDLQRKDKFAVHFGYGIFSHLFKPVLQLNNNTRSQSSVIVFH